MDKILTDFGVQPVYLAAQMVNFIILLLVLKKFLYRPILKVLQDRKKTISDSLLKSEQITTQLQTTEVKIAEELSEASRQARVIIANASKTAHRIIIEAHEKAQVDVDLMMEQGKQSISVEREMMKNEMHDELAGLVVLGMERVAGKVLDQPDHTKIVDQTINSLKEEISTKAD
jgi:F-type H+-transporting ATPase subunit b